MPNRRRFLQYSALASTGAAGFLLTGCSGNGTKSDSPSVTGTGVAEHAGVAGLQSPSVVQVIAHPDDDLYFMNPDTMVAAQAGVPLMSICLTAGEAGGIDADPQEQKTQHLQADRSGYAAARMAGLRRAYARMLNGDADSAWTRKAVTLAPGLVVEQATLEAMPHVRLVFFAMLEALDGRPQFKGQHLANLWAELTPTVPTIQVTDSPVTQTSVYSRETLIGALVTLLGQAHPTLVRTMDHDPEHVFSKKLKRDVSSDHMDHTSAALFALEAVKRYSATARRLPMVAGYRAYSNAFWPRNLDDPTRFNKYQTLQVYSGKGQPCITSVPCGDHNLDGLLSNDKRMGSTHTRYPGDSSWLLQQQDGRLAAFGVRAGQAVMWSQTKTGKAQWTGPTPISTPATGDGLVGQIGAVRHPDGRLRVFSLELTTVGPGSEQLRSIVTSVQSAPGGRFNTWENLAGPDGGDPAKCRELGLPYAAVDGQGWVHVVVRTYGRSLATRRLDPSSNQWTDWQVLAGPGVTDVQDNVSLVTRADGQVELFAGTRSALLHWTLNGGSVSAPQQLPLPVPAVAPTPVPLPDGRLVLFLRLPGTPTVMAAQLDAKGKWNTADTTIKNTGGFGRIAAIPYGSSSSHDVVLLARNGKGELVAGNWNADHGQTQAWVRQGPLHVGAPAVAVDGSGATVCAVTGIDGVLHTTVTPKGGQIASQLAS